jgi:hypothetical protein
VIHPFRWYAVINKGVDHVLDIEIGRVARIELGTLYCVSGSTLRCKR